MAPNQAADQHAVSGNRIRRPAWINICMLDSLIL